jgi:hypothetical protein
VGISLAHSCTPERSDDQVDYAGQDWDGRFSSAETPQGKQLETARWNGIVRPASRQRLPESSSRIALPIFIMLLELVLGRWGGYETDTIFMLLRLG